MIQVTDTRASVAAGMIHHPFGMVSIRRPWGVLPSNVLMVTLVAVGSRGHQPYCYRLIPFYWINSPDWSQVQRADPEVGTRFIQYWRGASWAVLGIMVGGSPGSGGLGLEEVVGNWLLLAGLLLVYLETCSVYRDLHTFFLFFFMKITFQVIRI